MDITIKILDGEDIKKAALLLEKIISSEIAYEVDGWVGIHVEVQ